MGIINVLVQLLRLTICLALVHIDKSELLGKTITQMAKLKSDPIQVKDLVEYLDQSSDFSFELSVLKMLRENDIECEHCGLYEDPVTGKSREFDIRAQKTIGRRRVRMAIECKNIRENFPILVSCIPRHKDESYHQVALLSDAASDRFLPNIMEPRARILSITDENSIYKASELVGKSTAQIGRAVDGVISANDNDLYEKWSQCVNSATELVRRMYWDGDKDDDAEDGDVFLSAAIPLVVVPNGRLWSVAYDETGSRVSQPQQTDRCSLFVEKDYEMGTKMSRRSIILTHVEIVTFDGMRSFVNKYLKTKEGIEIIFPTVGVELAVLRQQMAE